MRLGKRFERLKTGNLGIQADIVAVVSYFQSMNLYINPQSVTRSHEARGQYETTVDHLYWSVPFRQDQGGKLPPRPAICAMMEVTKTTARMIHTTAKTPTKTPPTHFAKADCVVGWTCNTSEEPL